MYSTVAANNRAYGADIVPVCYDDIYHADVVITNKRVASPFFPFFPLLFPTAEALLYGIMQLQQKIKRENTIART
jgi:NADH:ubiquinone oxidoreductase subunit B-like Fe-S oxidoreductase